MTGLHAQHLLHVLYDLALTLSGETEARQLAQRFLQRLLYHTGFSCALIGERTDTGGGAGRSGLRVLETMGNSALASKVGLEVNWPAWLVEDEPALLREVKLPLHLFARASHYATVLRLRLDEGRLLLLFGPAAPVGEVDLTRLFEPVVSRFARAYRLRQDHERNQQLVREASEARVLKEAAVYRIEQQVSDLLEASPLPTLTVDMENGRRLAFNAAATRLFGYSQEEVPDQPSWWLRAYPDPVYRRQMQALWAESAPRAMQEQSGFGPVMARITCKDGQVRVVDFYAKPFAGKMVLQAVDQTARQQAQAELGAARTAADQSSRAQASLLDGISQDLRAPLGVMLGHAERIAMAADGAPMQRENAREILACGRNLLNTVDAMLLLGRIERGTMGLEPDTVDLAAVVRDSVERWVAAGGHSDVVIEAGLEARVRGNADALRQIVTLMLGNATRTDRSHATVRLHGGAADAGRCRIAVETAAADRDGAAADPYAPPRYPAAGSTGKGEIGIGLDLARRLAERLSADIGFQDVPGIGARCWLDLPLAAQPVSSAPAEKAAGEEADGAQIVVAEDHPLNQSVIRLQLEKLGHVPVIAGNGAEALARWRAGGVGLILTDCSMPVMDGYALSTAIREAEAARGDGRRVAIVACTAFDSEEEKQRCYAAGMDDFLGKPVRIEQLRRVLERWLAPVSAALEGAKAGVSAAALASAAPERGQGGLDDLLPDSQPAVAETLLLASRQSAAACLREAADAVAGVEPASLFQALHKLKPSLRLLGAAALAEHCQVLESAARVADWKTIRAQLPSLERDVGALLRRAGAQGQAGPIAAAPPATMPEYPGLRGLRVLVVDDDRFIREYVSELLGRQAVASVHQASDGESALTILDAHDGDIDTLLCDLNMPGMDGIELIRHVGKHGFDGLLFLISGEDSRVLKTAYDLAEAYGLRVGGTLAKPFTPSRLYELLRQRGPAGGAAARRGGLPEIRPLEILEGLRRNEFSIHFQPKVAANTLELVGAEVLARWQRPSGDVPPAAFIPVAESHGLIDRLFLFVLSETLKLGSELNQAGRHLKFAVNMSALSLGSLDIPEYVLAKATERGFDPADLILEITESGVMRDMRTALDVLTRLRLRRVELSIDDFGTGYSSFEQLRRIPFSELKVDRAFVSGAVKDPTARSILETSVEVGRKLGLTLVAEGVETESDLELVRSVGCDIVQGYYIARPMPWPDFLAWIDSRRI